MMSRKLKHSVQEHLESISLSDEQLRKLNSFPQGGIPSSPDTRSTVRWSIGAALTAFIIAFFIAPIIDEQKNIGQLIALEVASNHIKQKPLEIETSSLDRIRSYFNKLDFVPVNSKLIDQSGLILIGGRYCSLQSMTAAQLRVKKPGSSVIQTLYQTEYRADLFDTIPVLEEGEEPVTIFIKGIMVKIWVEKGLLFALTDTHENNVLN